MEKNDSIHWYEEEDKEQLQLTVRPRGVLYLGRALLQQITGNVQIGFVKKECCVVVRCVQQGGFAMTKNGTVLLPKLAKDILKMGIRLPVTFCLERQLDGSWLGHAALVRLKEPHGNMRYDLEQVGLCYKWIIEKAVYKFARSTPIADRRAIAFEALWTTLLSYNEWDGPFETVLYENIKHRLLFTNHVFSTPSFRENVSMDRNLSRTPSSESFTRHDLFSDPDNQFMDLEERLMEEEFSKLLSDEEREARRLLLAGKPIREAAVCMGLPEESAKQLYNQLLKEGKMFGIWGE